MQKQLTRLNTPSQLLEFTVADKISSGEDFGPSEITHKHEMHDGKGQKTDIQMLTLPLVSMALICLHLLFHEHLIMHLGCVSTCATTQLEACQYARRRSNDLTETCTSSRKEANTRT
jgi:hypothetical protein